MSDSPKPLPSRKANRKVSGLSAGQILATEIGDLIALMGQVKDLSLELEGPGDLLDILEGIGRACNRLVTMLKAANQLGAGDEIGEAVRAAVLSTLGNLPIFQNSRAGGRESETSHPQESTPGRQPELPHAGETSAAAKPETTGARPAGEPAAGQKSSKRKSHARPE